jgi:peptide/nickel transport system substrate-binding protein
MRTAGLTAAASAGLLAVAACSGTTAPSGGTSSGGGTSAAKGGTLYYLTSRNAEHLDPQRTYIGRDIANETRLYYRNLVTFPISSDVKESTKPQPDLATDTGTSTEGGKVWSFTLKDGVKWQDGKDITCEDVKYGFSRGFATDVITGGPNYALAYLDVPQKNGLPVYNGPYKKAGQAEFDKAVTCEGKKITYRFNKPWIDFPLAVASLNFAAPYRADQDKGDQSNYAIFSDGPYKLQGEWKKGVGGTFVRNDQWSAATDSVRKALPDKIVFIEGLTPEIIAQRIIADSGNDKFAVTDRRVPASLYSQVDSNPAVKSRSTLVDAPFIDYVLPNFNRMKDVKVREALKVGADKVAYINAQGGEKFGRPAKSINSPALIGYKDNPSFSGPDSGDPAAAKKLLQEAGVTIPYPITYTYQGGTTETDNAAAALKAGWDKSGFKVTLQPLTDTYYNVIQNPANNKSDVLWGGWGADWPSMATVMPPLFDSRINLTEKSNGQDYGNYKSDAANKLIDEAALKPDIESAATVYGQLDDQLGKDVAYIPLAVQKFFFIRGSGVSNYTQTPSYASYPDLGGIGVSSK